MTQRYDDRNPSRGWQGRDWPGRDRERQRDAAAHPYGQREPYNWQSSPQPDYSGTPSDYGHRGESRYSESQFGQRRLPTSAAPTRYGSGDFGYEQGRRGEPVFGEGPFGDTSESPRFFGTGSYSEGGAHYTGGYHQSGEPPGSSRGDYDYDRHAGARPPQTRFKRGPKGYQRSDERLKEDISERLMMADHVDSSEVTVNVVGGKVTLEGSVPDRYMKHYIEDLADRCPGVQDVDNRIRVTSSWQAADRARGNLRTK